MGDVADVERSSGVLESLHQETISTIKDLKGMLSSKATSGNVESKAAMIPLPFPWQEHFSDNYNTTYYYNPDTGESVWERPVATDKRPPEPCIPPLSIASTPITSITTRNAVASSQSTTSSSPATALKPHPLSSQPQREAKNTIAQRSKLLLAAKKRREDEIRRQREEHEQQQVVGAPKITKKSQKLNRNIDSILAWNDEKQKRLEERQQTFAAQQEAELTGRPQIISKQSAKILEQSSRYDDDLTVEERLLEYEERKRLKHIARMQEENLKAREAASGAVRPTTVSSSRLYQQASAKRAAREQRILLEKQKEMKSMFQPKINKTSLKLAEKSRPAAPVEDILNYQGKLYQHNAEVRKQRSDIRDQIQRSSKKLNPTSERILQSREGEAAGTDRLLKPTGNVRVSTIESMDLPTFRPQLSTNHTPSSRTSGDIYTKSQKWLQDKERRLQQQRLQFEEEQMQECSFTPFASDGTVVSADSGGSGGQNGVLERTLEWQRKKERDIERMRKQQMESELKECSFAPRRVTNIPAKNVPPPPPPTSISPPLHHRPLSMPVGHFSQSNISSLYSELHSYDSDEPSPYSSPYAQPPLPSEDEFDDDEYREQFEQLNLDGYDISELDVDGYDEYGPPPQDLETSFDVL